MNKKV